jgi:hypothetical protein
MFGSADGGATMAGTPWTRPQKIGFGTLLVTAFSAVAALGWLGLELHKLRKEEEAQRVQEWQKVTDYKIIQKYFLKNRATISFEEIKTAYVTEASRSDKIDLPKEELQDLTLRKILLDLMTSSLVYETTGGKYVVNQADINKKFDRFFVIEDAAEEIIGLLHDKDAKYTAEQLKERLEKDKKIKLSSVEYDKLLLELVGKGWVTIDGEGFLRSRLHPAKKG